MGLPTPNQLLFPKDYHVPQPDWLTDEVAGELASSLEHRDGKPGEEDIRAIAEVSRVDAA
jgi:hypothetical protein